VAVAASPAAAAGAAVEGAAAAGSYERLPRAELPLALAELHRSLPVGAEVELRFNARDHDAIDDLAAGAGFAVDEHIDRSTVRATRERALPDYVRAGLRVLCVGLNPSLHAADAGVGYVTGSNRFWSAARAAGLIDVDRDPWLAVARGVGFTDVVKRATARADELSTEEYRDGFARLERMCAWLEPGVVVFVGLAGWRAAVDRHAQPGRQERTVGGRPAYVLPSTSGLNARTSLAELTAHLEAALALAVA
jgi:TDG/mug DNA glycosylase family protein